MSTSEILAYFTAEKHGAGSGTGELVGLSGRMSITIGDGNHSYDFEYAIAGAPRG